MEISAIVEMFSSGAVREGSPQIVLVWLRTEFFILLNFNKFNWPQGLVATLFWGAWANHSSARLAWGQGLGGCHRRK